MLKRVHISLSLLILTLTLLCIVAILNRVVFKEDNDRGIWARANHAGVSHALREYSAILEKYKEDNGKYPDPRSGNTIPPSIQSLLPELPRKDSDYRLDLFSEDGEQPYMYLLTKDEALWLIASRGPDQRFDIETAEIAHLETSSFDYFRGKEYDPTNGMISSGDIIRTNSR